MSTPHINDLRQHLLDTLQALRDRANPMEPDPARAVAQVAGVLVDSARVEVDFLKVTQGGESQFLGVPKVGDGAQPGGLHPGIVAVRQHRLQG